MIFYTNKSKTQGFSVCEGLLLTSVCCQHNSIVRPGSVEVVAYQEGQFGFRIDNSINVYTTTTENVLLRPNQDEFFKPLFTVPFGVKAQIIKVHRSKKRLLHIKAGDIECTHMSLSSIFNDFESVDKLLMMYILNSYTATTTKAISA